eukprot:CAMPEP_0197233268 /NCGR_PEP_ID=MMETSP1429-20130617/1377_1 /TAXON_ID=49237 /ORGANISM="Chaetoceros  sp., Strain UNC1202" /LENGTH=312 /DNA_ID=CAMNT_0042691485 /DNA_START=161 /DNA_END=1099 /DNA_ORIENTATION=-
MAKNNDEILRWRNDEVQDFQEETHPSILTAKNEPLIIPYGYVVLVPYCPRSYFPVSPPSPPPVLQNAASGHLEHHSPPQQSAMTSIQEYPFQAFDHNGSSGELFPRAITRQEISLESRSCGSTFPLTSSNSFFVGNQDDTILAGWDDDTKHLSHKSVYASQAVDHIGTFSSPLLTYEFQLHHQRQQQGRGQKRERRKLTTPKSSKAIDQERSDISYVVPVENDILFGRGRGGRSHHGNLSYRQAVEATKGSYQHSENTREKQRIIQSLMDDFHSQGIRFLIHAPQDPSRWVVAGLKMTRRKVAQALREKGTG